MEELADIKTKDAKKYHFFKLLEVMKTLSTIYDIVRLVDPEECRTLSIDTDGAISTGGYCFSVWSCEHRCSNCTSFKACRTNRTYERSEYYQGKRFDIHSMPIVIELPDYVKFSCVMELITAEEIEPSESAVYLEKQNGNGDYLLLHDDMTNLYNYEGFLRATRTIITENHDIDYIIAVADIRGFKVLNSQLGREKGNEILVAISKIIQQELPKGAVVGRSYADRYAFCIPEPIFDESQLLKISNRLNLDTIALEYRMILHFGLYRVHNNDLPIPFMIDRAMMAMRNIHKKGESGIAWFNEQILNEVTYEQQVISRFEQNLKNGQFHMYLQPQVNAQGRMIGAEALVRWQWSDGKVELPAKFIPMLEESSLVCKLDQYIWEQAAAQIGKWQKKGIEDIYISINVSSKDFYFLDIPKVLFKLCEKYHVPAHRLHVEITETAVMEQMEQLTEIINQLHAYHFLVEIDDFGKGNSALSLLKDIDADVIKIDMEFLRETENRLKSRVILEADISMVNCLEMQVITEGVETEEQIEHLKQMGCSIYQGYYFSKPIPVKEFEEKYFS
jgi:EAL domain-containing protein (putative c-di-GMP-specific phosphodiesterase class I)/GGDEF domain-containing protein